MPPRWLFPGERCRGVRPHPPWPPLIKGGKGHGGRDGFFPGNGVGGVRATPPGPPLTRGGKVRSIVPPFDGARKQHPFGNRRSNRSQHELSNIQQPLRTGVTSFLLLYQYPVKGSHVQWISDLVILCGRDQHALDRGTVPTECHAATRGVRCRLRDRKATLVNGLWLSRGHFRTS